MATTAAPLSFNSVDDAVVYARENGIATSETRQDADGNDVSYSNIERVGVGAVILNPELTGDTDDSLETLDDLKSNHQSLASRLAELETSHRNVSEEFTTNTEANQEEIIELRNRLKLLERTAAAAPTAPVNV